MPTRKLLIIVLVAAFARTSAVQVELGKVLSPEARAFDWFGWSMAVDGNVAVVGVPYSNDVGFQSGSAYVFRFDGATWAFEQKLQPDDPETTKHFGFSVAIDNDVIVVGAPLDDENGTDAGAAYAFRFDGNVWAQEDKMTASDGLVFDELGTSVAVRGDEVLTGARFANGDIEGQAGAAYVFRSFFGRWPQWQKIIAPDGQTDDRFGTCVAMHGDAAVIGAPRDDDGGVDAGSAYVYRLVGQAWTAEQKLTAADAEAGDLFGTAAIDGDTVVVGAPGDDDAGADAGSAYVYQFGGADWAQTHKLLATDADAGDSLGGTSDGNGGVAIRDGVILLGASRDDERAFDAGAAYIFVSDGQDWFETSKLTASDGDFEDRFGVTVALSSRGALVAAPEDEDAAQYAGSVYAFCLDRSTPTAFTVGQGDLLAGGLADLRRSDDAHLVAGQRAPLTPLLPAIGVDVQATVCVDAPAQIVLTVEAASNALPNQPLQRLSMFDDDAGAWETVDERIASLSDAVIEVTIDTDAARFVEAGTGTVKARGEWFDPGEVFFSAWNARLDVIGWGVAP